MSQSGIGYSSLILRMFTLEKERRISAFIIDETMVQIGGRNEAWMWIAIEPIHSTVLRITAVYSNCGGTWYPEARSSLGLKHIAHMFRERPD